MPAQFKWEANRGVNQKLKKNFKKQRSLESKMSC